MGLWIQDHRKKKWRIRDGETNPCTHLSSCTSSHCGLVACCMVCVLYDFRLVCKIHGRQKCDEIDGGDRKRGVNHLWQCGARR